MLAELNFLGTNLIQLQSSFDSTAIHSQSDYNYYHNLWYVPPCMLVVLETCTGAKGEFPSVIRTTNMCIKFDQHEI